MKKILFLAMALIVNLCAWSASDFEVDGISYAILSEEDLTAEVVYNEGAYVGDVTIPARVSFDGKTYTVAALHNQAFFKCADLYSVSIPATVSELGQYTFSQCTSLASVELPSGITAIPNGTFYGCSALTAIQLPETVESIGEYSFSNCSALKDINMPAGITFIGKCALMATALESFTVPQTVTELSPYVLALTTNLKTVTLHDGVKTIGECALQGNTAMTTIQLPAGLETIEASAFAQCQALEDITVPDGIKAIPTKCFYNDMALRRIVMGKNVSTLGAECFARYKSNTKAPKLQDVYLTADEIVTGGDSFIDEACAGATLHVPSALVEAYKADASWSRFSSIVAIQDGELDGIATVSNRTATKQPQLFTPSGIRVGKGYKGAVKVATQK